MSVSIVVPVHNALECARACVDSLYSAGSGVPFEVVVVNNGSSSEAAEWLAEEQARRNNLRALHFAEPLGFARAVNEGARAARFNHLVVLNSDTVATPGWLDALLAVFDQDAGIGIVSPVTNNCGHHLQADPDAKGVTAEQAGGYAARIRGREALLEPQRLVFFCVLVRRALWERLAGLDEGYLQGNYEDDDFCLRARMMGYRLAVARGSFVFHHERRTFDSNRLDHAETLARNQALFHSRAARWSKQPPLVRPAQTGAEGLSVIVPVLNRRIEGLRDSLASLANQTVGGFEVVVVSAEDLTEAARDFALLNIRTRRVTEDRAGSMAALLNEGLCDAGNRRVAFLPCGDVYYPFHLEALLTELDADAAAAYTSFSFFHNGRTGAPRFDQVAPDHLAVGDWAPLTCWMCADAAAAPRFDETLRDWSGWDYCRRLVEAGRVRYLPRVTCQKTVKAAPDTAELERVLAALPAGNAWQAEERRQFARAVASGAWEAALVFGRNEIERRARRLLKPAEPLTTNPRELDLLRGRLGHAAACVAPEAATPAGAADILLFNIVGWTHLTQRPHHFARGLAELGRRVFWIDVQLQPPALADSATLARPLEPNLWYVTLPAAKGDVYLLEWSRPVLSATEEALAFLACRFGVQRAVQLVNFPKWVPLVERLRQRFGWPVVYDCLDNQQAFGDLHRHNEAHLEAALVRDAALVVTSGRTLYELQSPRNPNTIFISNAADYELFSSAVPKGLLRHLPKPIAGFFGAFSEWLDRGWIAAAAKRFPSWSFVYIGREGFARSSSQRDWQAAVSAPNITVLPQAAPALLADYLAEFDACIMPFRDLPITRSMNAVKLYEYLAAGKPVVAPDLPEVRPLAEKRLVAVYREWEQSFALLEQAVALGTGEELVRARREFASSNTWRHRVGALDAALRRVVEWTCATRQDPRPTK